jgi:hypothetical protein
MRLSLGLVVALGTATLAAFACGGSGESEFDPNAGSGIDEGSSGVFGGSSSGGGSSGGSSGSSSGDPTAGDIDETSMRIDPADATITVLGGQQISQAYKLFGKLKGTSTEIDLTNRAVFYVPDNYLVGGFPLNGAPTFTTRLPQVATDPPQRGGRLTVQALASNSAGTIQTTTSLTVKLNATLNSPNVAPALPANPAASFAGAATPARAPVLAYPNHGAMLPPNLNRLEVQWRPGSASNTLYEISFTSSLSTITYYSRCGGTGLVAGACGFELDGAGYGYLAETHRGAGPVKLRVRGSDDAATGWGESAEFDVEFAESRVDGGLYYWRIQSGPEGIMRFDFGAAGGVPEMIIQEGTPAGIATCPGCHALSRDGTKMVGSIGGQNDGRLVFMNDMSKSNADPTFLTVSPTSTEGGNNRIQFASFNPTGSEFVAVYGDYGTNNTCIPGDATYGPNCNLFFHNGTTGLRDPAKTKALAFKPDHPDWSPNGNFIAVTRVRGPANSGNTTQMPKETSLELLTKNPDGTFADPVTLVERDNTSAQYKVRYNPNFVPDSSFLLFNESTCPGQNFDNDACDGDSNPTAKVWAVKPQANADPALRATPVFLANSAALGVEDVRVARAHTGDTFPRSAPFQTAHRGGKLFWFTVASRRSVGLRATAGTQHLWMFAVDPAKVLAGQDGSYTGFYLPFQDLQTSNHIAQWTEKVVGGSQPPPAPVPPPPPPPPPPPAGGIR